MNKEKELIDKLIDLAFAEDIGDGDHTTLSCIPATAMGKSKLLIKEAGVLAGIEVAKEIFNRFDPTMKVEVFINDGTEVKPGDVAMVVEGKVQSLLQTERLMLNVMQRMSGLAALTPVCWIPARQHRGCVSSKRWLSKSVAESTIVSACSI